MSSFVDMAETLLGTKQAPSGARTTRRRGELRRAILDALAAGPMTANDCYVETGWDSKASFSSRLGKLVADGEVLSIPGYPHRYALA